MKSLGSFLRQQHIHNLYKFTEKKSVFIEKISKSREQTSIPSNKYDLLSTALYYNDSGLTKNTERLFAKDFQRSIQQKLLALTTFPEDF